MLTRYIILFIATMVAGLTVLFYGQRVPTLQEFDIQCIRAVSPPEERIYELNDETQTVSSFALSSSSASTGLPFHLIEITDDPAKIFENTPPSPLDYAVILHTLREQGAENVILTTRMSWDGDLGLTADALSNKLSDFPQASIPLPLTRGVTAQDLPEVLSKSMIPFSNVKGNQESLPIVNQVAIPTIITNAGETRAGFSEIESLPRNESTIPMICIWENQGIVPSLELLAVMAAHKVEPKDIQIQCGKHIRLGVKGPIIPIREFGEVTRPKITAPESTQTSKAEDLINPNKDQEGNADTEPSIYLIHAVGEKTQASNALPSEHISAIIHWSESLPSSCSTIEYKRVLPWVEIGTIIIISLLACWFSTWSRGSRHLGFLLTLIMLYPLLHLLIAFPKLWLSLAAPIVAIIVAWLVPVKRAQLSSPETSDI